MTTVSPQYDPHEHEPTMYKKWEASGAFSPFDKAQGQPRDAVLRGEPYVIMMPLPNVTGSLHMGHALNGTMQDILTRYHRMLGEAALWQPGTDHAGIATQTMVEKELKKERKTRQSLGREKFLERVWAWKEKYGHTIVEQQKRLGLSCDWSRSVFTMDPDYVRAVQEVFVRYYQKGYLYRGERIVNWDPTSQTTVSDLEIEWQTEKAPLYTLKYGPFKISTARPETKFGDKYIVVHPNDPRYAEYQPGQKIELEWINGRVTATVIKDEAVDMAFGTGAMTITPWHDAVDFAIAERQGLDKEPIIGLDGKLLPIAGEFAGLRVREARPKIVEKLVAKGLLVKIDETYSHNVAVNDRGKGLIEPQIMRQWFVDMSKLKQETIDVAEKELIKFHPPRWKQHFLTWMENVHDWTISRQLWWGQPIPAWWKPGTRDTDHEDGNYIVSLDPPAGGSGEGYEADPDVLDTWFSSAIWPLATLGWPRQSDDLDRFYPTSVLVTARDILYLWVARMIFSGLELMQGEEFGNRPTPERIPFRDVVIHPTVLNKKGQRMSKSLGTGVDPLELIEKYGADATRFGLMYQMTYDSQAIKFDEEAIKSARNFANKIWNLNRLLESLSPSSEGELEGVDSVGAVSVADIWIESRLNETIKDVTNLLNQFKLGEAARLLYDFVWKDFADWYVEILKVEGSAAHAQAIFQKLLALLHPFMPHITEVLWQGESMLIVSEWFTPSEVEEPATLRQAQGALKSIERFKSIVSAIRSTRVLLGIPPSEEITVAVTNPPLPAALSALAKAKLTQATKSMRAFPTAAGETFSISADSLTPERLAAARARLEQQAAQLKDQMAYQRKTIARMRGKATAERLAIQEEVLAQTEKQLAEVTHSLKLLV